jgi:uncharacterized protein (TIGR02246 family)
MAGSRSLFWAFSLGLVACTQPASDQAAAPAIDSVAVRAAADDFWARYIAADTAGNLDALMTLWDDSVRADVRGAPVLLGKAAVRAFVEPIFRTTKYTAMSVTPDMTVPISNEMLYQNGSYMQTSTSGGKSAAEHGRFAVALLKGADGQWRLGYIMAFSDSVVPAKP